MIRITAAVVSAFIAAAQLAAQGTGVIIQGASIIDVSTGAVQPAQTVLVEGNRIAAVGPQNTFAVPPDAVVVEGTGAFLIPGLWDMHVHATYGDDIPAFFPLFIANGITGIRDAWGSLEGAADAQAAVAAGRLVGPPRISAAGALIDGPARIWPDALVALTPADGVRLADSLHAAGVPFLKVYSSLMPQTFFAIADRARALGLPFIGHVPELVPTAAAANAGMRSMEHLAGIVKGCSSEEDSVIAYLGRELMRALDPTTNVWDIFVQRDRRLLASQDETRCRTLAARLARNQTWQVPTLVTNRGYAMMRELAAAGDERLRYVPRQLLTFWMPATNPFASKWSADSWETTAARYARELQLLPMLAHAGVPILAGTDTPNPWAFPGFGIHDELELLVEAGLTPLQALQAATLNPARFLDRTDDLGSVAAGKFADLVLLDGNPLSDITNTRRIRAVVANGRVYSRAELDSLLVGVADRNGTAGAAALAQAEAAPGVNAMAGNHLDVAGGRIWYQVTTGGSGTPVVLLHGGPGLPSVYLKSLEALGDERRVVRYDQLGSGYADAVKDTSLFTIAHFVEELDSLRMHLGLERMHVYGHSWGSILAYEYYRAHPARVASLVLASPALDMPAFFANYAKLLAAISEATLHAAELQESGQPYDTVAFRSGMAEFVKRHQQTKPGPDADSLGMLANPLVAGHMMGSSILRPNGTLKDYDAVPFLMEIGIPVLYMVGETDFAGPDLAQRFARRTPHARLVVIPRSGHMMMWDQPDAHLQAVREFLREVDGR